MTRCVRRDAGGGQALVEFSLVIVIFLVLVMGIIDLGRGIYMYNGVAEASREVARVTSVHPFATGNTTLGSSPEATTARSTQQGLVPGLTFPAMACVDITGATVSGVCTAGDSVKVTATTQFRAVTPLLFFFGTFTLSSSSSVKLQ